MLYSNKPQGANEERGVEKANGDKGAEKSNEEKVLEKSNEEKPRRSNRDEDDLLVGSHLGTSGMNRTEATLLSCSGI